VSLSCDAKAQRVAHSKKRRGADTRIRPDTTRAPRPGEVDGTAYHFVSKQAFEEVVKQDGFAEYTTSYDT
jgi:guanylate kinase